MSPDTSHNSSFSRHVPGLQLAVDSTSLGALKTCGRFYYYSIIEGWEPRGESPHLRFGIELHHGREVYDHAKAQGQGHEEALRATVKSALTRTWDRGLGRPWTSDHPSKNRLSLLRALVWYLDEYGPRDALQTIILANGKPAVELSFRFDSLYRTSWGETWELCGHLDRLAEMDGRFYIPDVKSTERQLSPGYFAQFSPNNQFTLYALAGRIVWAKPIEGVIVDAIQVGAGFARWQRQLVHRDQALLAEWHRGLESWLRLAEGFALDAQENPGEPWEAWPMNDTSCDKFMGCRFREVCSASPGARTGRLERGFKRRVWDPLIARGDI